MRGSACGDRIVVESKQVRKVIGGEGNDVIVVNPWVEVIEGGAGDDVIYGELTEAELATKVGGAAVEETEAPPGGPIYRIRNEGPKGPAGTATASAVECEAGKSCYGGSGNQTMVGSAGNDRIFGQRGNDEIYGNGGNDALYGGVGDESIVSGGAGNDLVSGGYGADQVNGNEGSDLVRGDATIDKLYDTGASGTDTLSFATAVAPGFTGSVGVSGFPADGLGEERGVDVRLDGGQTSCGFVACNNNARYGGGADEGDLSGFENVIGSPFADRIVGDSGANRIDGGGGADIIEALGGDDTIYGGADGDYIDAGSGTDTAIGQGGSDNCLAETSDCEGSSEEVDQRDRSKITVGYQATSVPGYVGWVSLYLVGSEDTDKVNVKYETPFVEVPDFIQVTFSTEGGSAEFDTSSAAKSSNCSYASDQVVCTPPEPLDAITLAGMAGDDTLNIAGGATEWEDTATPYILGGQGSDLLKGSGQTEDVLVDGDGTGNDTLYGYGYDESLVNNEGSDNLQGGNGNDLILSAATCGADNLQGAESGSGDGTAVNNTSWAKMPSGGVTVSLEAEEAGDHYDEGPACASGSLDAIRNIDHLEGSNQGDAMFGDGADNFILGRIGEDFLYGLGGNDTIQGQDGFPDTLGGGGGTGDTCHYDHEIDTRETCEGGDVSVPPLTVTNNASGIDADSATLNGTVDPQSKATTYWFQWGTSTAYGNETAHESAGSGASPVAKAKEISGLADDTTYHFRIVAENSEGTSYGKDKSFTTDAAAVPPSATTEGATGIEVKEEAGQATLHGKVNPQGSSTAYRFEWGTSTEYGNSVPVPDANVGSGTGDVAVEQTISALQGQTTYHYRLVATNEAGTTYGADKTFETPDWRPVAMTDFGVEVTIDSAVLKGTINPEGLATTYQFEYGLTDAYGSSVPASPKGIGSGKEEVGVSEAIGDLDPSTTYHFRVVAENAAGTATGADRTFITSTTALCESAVEPCPGDDQYPASSAIEASAGDATLEIENVFFGLDGSVSCEESSLTGGTAAQADSPLPIEFDTWSFSGCEDSLEIAPEVWRDCTVGAQNEPYAGALSWTGSGNGLLGLTSEGEGEPGLHVECLDENPFTPDIDCTYSFEPELELEGGEAAQLSFAEEPMSEAETGKCPGSAPTFSAGYEIDSPQPLFVASAPPTVLCDAAEEPCPSEAQYPASSAFEASAVNTLIVLEHSFLGYIVVSCEESSLVGETTTQVGAPLAIEFDTWSFSGCNDSIVPPRGCTVSAQNDPDGLLNWSGGGDGVLKLASSGEGEPTLRVECLDEIPFTPDFACNYSFEPELELEGGEVVQILFAEEPMSQHLPGPCLGHSPVFSAAYEVGSPQPLFVERG